MDNLRMRIRIKWGFPLAYFIITLLIFALCIFDWTFIYLGILLFTTYLLDRQWHQRVIPLAITTIYIILSFILVARLDPLLLLRSLTLQEPLGYIYSNYILLIGCIVTGIIMGIYSKRIRFKFCALIILGIAIASVCADLISVTLNTDYLINILRYLVGYFIVYGVELLFWFFIIYGLIQFFMHEVFERKTEVSIT